MAMQKEHLMSSLIVPRKHQVRGHGHLFGIVHRGDVARME